jgi:hypothetical protein
LIDPTGFRKFPTRNTGTLFLPSHTCSIRQRTESNRNLRATTNSQPTCKEFILLLFDTLSRFETAFFYLFARTKDENEESNFMARVTHVGRMFEAHDPDVASR